MSDLSLMIKQIFVEDYLHIKNHKWLLCIDLLWLFGVVVTIFKMETFLGSLCTMLIINAAYIVCLNQRMKSRIYPEVICFLPMKREGRSTYFERKTSIYCLFELFVFLFSMYCLIVMRWNMTVKKEMVSETIIVCVLIYLWRKDSTMEECLARAQGIRTSIYRAYFPLQYRVLGYVFYICLYSVLLPILCRFLAEINVDSLDLHELLYHGIWMKIGYMVGVFIGIFFYWKRRRYRLGVDLISDYSIYKTR